MELIPEVYRQHLDEFQALWEQRQELLTDSELRDGDLAEFDARIDAHLDALLLPGADAIPLLGGTLQECGTAMFAAAYVLLRMGRYETTQLVLQAVLLAEEEHYPQLVTVLACFPVAPIESDLRETVASGSLVSSLLAAEALATHGRLDAACPRLPEFHSSDDAFVRQGAWRVSLLTDVFSNVSSGSN